MYYYYLHNHFLSSLLLKVMLSTLDKLSDFFGFMFRTVRSALRVFFLLSFSLSPKRKILR